MIECDTKVSAYSTSAPANRISLVCIYLFAYLKNCVGFDNRVAGDDPARNHGISARPRHLAQWRPKPQKLENGGSPDVKITHCKLNTLVGNASSHCRTVPKI